MYDVGKKSDNIRHARSVQTYCVRLSPQEFILVGLGTTIVLLSLTLLDPLTSMIRPKSEQMLMT